VELLGGHRLGGEEGSPKCLGGGELGNRLLDDEELLGGVRLAAEVRWRVGVDANWTTSLVLL
jgi:hypothetical protein